MTGASSMSDFLSSHLGTAKPLNARRWRQLRLLDKLYDARVRLGRGMRKVRREAARLGPARVLVVGIEVPSRAADIHSVVGRLHAGSRHDMIAIAARADLALAQPAHGFASHATYSITRRRFGSLARRTDFVEIGPLTLVRADLFAELVPFPPSRWCYGIDLLWSEVARRRGKRIGIVDATPVRHLRPVAASYDMGVAREEGRALLVEHGITINRAELFARDELVLRA